MKPTKENIIRAIIYLLGAIGVALGVLFGLPSCQVVREITTSSSYYQKGDTNVVIQTKTIESYTGKKQ